MEITIYGCKAGCRRFKGLLGGGILSLLYNEETKQWEGVFWDAQEEFGRWVAKGARSPVQVLFSEKEIMKITRGRSWKVILNSQEEIRGKGIGSFALYLLGEVCQPEILEGKNGK